MFRFIFEDYALSHQQHNLLSYQPIQYLIYRAGSDAALNKGGNPIKKDKASTNSNHSKIPVRKTLIVLSFF